MPLRSTARQRVPAAQRRQVHEHPLRNGRRNESRNGALPTLVAPPNTVSGAHLAIVRAHACRAWFYILETALIMKRSAVVLLAALAAGAACAKEVGSIAGRGAGIVLFDDRMGCPEGTTSALYLDSRLKVRGCWFEAHEHVWLWFEDGDTYGIPKRLITFARS
jgi:hypothetical protein